MTLSEFSIKNHVFAWMLMVFLIVFGAIAYQEMGISLNPDVDFPTASIRVSYEGASVEVIEKNIIDPIEETVVAVQGIKNISSTARLGQADITVEFDIDKDIDIAVQELQTQLLRANRNLPDDIDPPVITKSNPDDRPIIFLVISSETLSKRDLMILVNNRIQDRFSNINGVSEVSVYGYVDPTIRVDLDVNKLNQYELTTQDIINAIQREHAEYPAGWIERNDKEESLRVMGEITNAAELAEIIIKNRGGQANFLPLKISDVAKVYEGLDEVRRINRVDGKPTLAMGIRKQRGSNSVAVADEVIQRVEELQASLPSEVKLEVNFDNTLFIRESVSELVFTLILSAILTAIVCWLFLGSFSATLNIILAIPTSVIGSFIFLNLLGFTLNTFTLLGLSLAIGIVVDDAIIMLENIFRYLEKGKNKKEAAIIGSKEITFAVIATTAAVVAIFLPIAFMKGVIGKFFFQFGVTISIAVIISTIEALTLAPMRLSRFGKAKQNKMRIVAFVDKILYWFRDYYLKLLNFSLNHRYIILGIAGIFFTISLSLFSFFKYEFAPAQDERRSFINIKTAQGSSLDFTNERVLEVEKYIKTLPWVDRYYVSVGGFGGGGKVNTAIMIVFYNDKNNRPINQATGANYSLKDMEKDLREGINNIEGIRAFVNMSTSQTLGGSRGYPIEFTLQGSDYEKLISTAKDFITELEKTKTMVGINSEDIETKPEIQITPNRGKTKEFGVPIESITETIQAMYGGIKPVKYSSNGRRYDVLVKLPEDQRVSLEPLNEIYVRNNRGELVEFKDLIETKPVDAPLYIYREDRERGVRISANIDPESSQGEALQAVQSLAETKLPKDIYVKLSGSSETFYESFESLIIVMILGILVSYMVLASQFNSFVDPLIILSALPFSISGALISLYLGGQSINIYSVIGIILLIGIAKKNSIMLVEFANQLRDQGLDKLKATIESANLRFRPIMMTSIATIAAAIPAAVNFGPGAETRIPMALAVIGGVIVSTALTLIVVPVLYQWISPKLDHQEIK
jgi:HAE1 family hydrophobic/amphiphilic exporter-1